MNEYELRRRLGLGPDVDYDWVALRGAYLMSDHTPILLNDGHGGAQPLTVEMALGWAERLADEWLA